MNQTIVDLLFVMIIVIMSFTGFSKYCGGRFMLLDVYYLMNQKENGYVGDYYDYVSGAAEDGNGRLYISCAGLRAMSPISSVSLYPYVANRYSLWTYEKNLPLMTPPVIGEDNWLYVGCGDDILAIGD